MLIAIMSDSHDNITNLNVFLDYCKREKIEQIICCGDVTNSETLNILANGFEGTIHLVKGNQEIYHEEEIARYRNIKYYKKIGYVEIDNIKIALCHEPFLIDKIMSYYKDIDFIFYGDTHKPWIENKGETKIANPGTLGGVFQEATFSVFDTKGPNLELKLLDLA